MSQMCPNCSHDNPDDAQNCSECPAPLRNLLGYETTLGERYQVISVLGHGAMGAVYLANDQRLSGRRCAIKENRPAPNLAPKVLAQLREQFLAEANILAQLDHPGLTKVSDYFIENRFEYLVMDYVDGEDLDSLLQRTGKPLEEASVLDWALQVLDALDYLHNQTPKPIIHRDIKPPNIRLNLRNKVKLVDFGLVKLLDSSNPETKVELRGMGTPAYAPLEQFAGSEEHTNARSDLYALGATMYHLLTNLYPPDVHQRMLNPELLPPIRELNTAISKNTERVVMRAMGIHPKERYKSAEEMSNALQQTDKVAGGKSISSIPILPLLVAILGLALIALIIGGTYFAVFGTGKSTPQPNIPPQQVTVIVMATPTRSIVRPIESVPTATTVVKTATVVVKPPTITPKPSLTPTSLPTATPTHPAVLNGTIAYPVFNNGSYSIYLGQADGSGNKFLLSEASQPAFSPDGSRIAFHSWKRDRRGIVIANSDGANPIPVTNFVEDQLPTWSADGTAIILLSRRDGISRRSQLIKIDNLRELSDGNIIAEGEYPSIGQNGQLVFKGWGNSDKGLQYSAIVDNKLDNKQTVTDSEKDTAPALSPDGQKIAFMSNRDGNWEIYIVNIDGSNLKQLTTNPTEDGLPTWSPDGNSLAFVSSRNGEWAMWAMTPKGNSQRKLFAMEGSPNGFIDNNNPDVNRGWAEERISWKK